MLRVVVTYWNAEPYIATCLKSIASQRYTDWTCVIYDDCSTDGSYEKAARTIRNDRRFSLVMNDKKHWQVGNWWQFLQRSEIDDSDIVITIDGDDWLPDRMVFDRVVEAYADGVTWVTYGNFLRKSGLWKKQVGYCRKVECAARIRSLPWTSSALRTFKAFLFRKIKFEDLLWQGEFLPAAGDKALMFPIIEMAGDERNKCLDSINYVYNVRNPRCGYKLKKDLQEDLNLYLRNKPPYRQIDSLAEKS